MVNEGHVPVLLAEAIEQLNIQKDGIYVDATFGRGGHARAILSRLGVNGRLYAIDKDPLAIEAAQLIKDQRFSAQHGSFTLLQSWMESIGLLGKVNGVLLDVGVSSPQLDDSQRGFSFLRDGVLDMRMDTMQKLNAAIWINSASKKEIEEVLCRYGEERFYRKIAAAIVDARLKKRIETTLQLAEIVSKAHPRWELHKHPATRTFQAIRILINDELCELTACLEQCLRVLANNGRIAAITFHSLEFRIVKGFMQRHGLFGNVPREIPLTQEHSMVRLKRIVKGLRPTEEEIALNPRARSAMLQVAEKIV
jgi:16S rRNA (cytosine1402-N4)-methyltransferase